MDEFEQKKYPIKKEPEAANEIISGTKWEVWQREVADNTGTCAAGVAGAYAFSKVARSKYGSLAAVVSAALAGGLARVTAKGTVESFALPQQPRTTSFIDLGLGAFDGLSGVVGGCGESLAAKLCTRSLGKKFAGSSLDNGLAEKIGIKVVNGSIPAYLYLQSAKGITAGAFSNLVSTLPHSIYDHHLDLRTASGWHELGKETTENTLLGALCGGLFGSSFALAVKSKEIFRYARTVLPSGQSLPKVDILHFNDMHSALLGNKATLPQLASEVERLREQARLHNTTALLFELGDNYSGNVVSGHTDVGYVETKAIQMMKPDAVIPGNHVADVGHGNVDVRSWVRNVVRIEKESGRNFPGLASNIDLPRFRGFIDDYGKYKPWRIVEVPTAHGRTTRIGLLGLITHELESAAGGDVIYRDAQATAKRIVDEMNEGGIDKIVVLSHLGRSEDVDLARNVAGISAIIGGHSHDIEPLPLWIKNKQTGADVPIVQAGEKANYLGELNLVFKQDGMADKYRSSGRLHLIDENVKPNKEIETFVQNAVGKVNDLALRKYPAIVGDRFPLQGIRGEQGNQTPLATLVSRALLQEVNANLPTINKRRVVKGDDLLRPFNIILKHSGDIRDGIVPGSVNHLQLSNVFLNTGNAERELSELAAVELTGAQIERALNFSVHDLPAATKKGSRLPDAGKLSVDHSDLDHSFDYSGNFLHAEGLRYQFDRSLPPGRRIVKVEVADGEVGKYVPLELNRKYDVLTLYHPVEKWGNKGLLTNDKNSPDYHKQDNWVFGKKLQKAEARSMVNARSIELSQVDLLADYLVKAGKVKAGDFHSVAVKDVTPLPYSTLIQNSSFGLLSAYVVMTRQKEERK